MKKVIRMVLPYIAAGVVIGFLIGGGNDSNMYARINQDINNTVYQELNADCKAVCSTALEDITVVLIDTKLKGSINFTDKCTVTANCAINQSADTLIKNVTSASTEQSAFIQNSLISIGGGTTTETRSEIEQRIKNQITQVLNSSCHATNRSTTRNVVLYIKGGEVGEGIQFTQGGGNVSATCAMNNTAKISIYNQQVAETKMQTTILSWGGFIILVIGVVVVLVVLGLSLIAVLKGKKKPENTGVPGNNGVTGE